MLKVNDWLNTSLVVGPDLGKSRKARSYMIRFLQKIAEKKDSIDYISLHHYYKNVKDIQLEDLEDLELYNSLETFLIDTANLIKAADTNHSIWLTETSSISGGGADGISNTFANGFFWLDKLGVSSKVGVKNVFRQTFLGSHYGLLDYDFNPRPDYWLTWLYKRLVGNKVLQVMCQKCSSRRFMRVYAHCANHERSRYNQGDIVVFFVNPLRNKHRLLLPKKYYLNSNDVDLYLFEPYPAGNITSKESQVNKQVLRYQEDREMMITPSHLSREKVNKGIRIPVLSYGFIVLKDANAEACL